MVLFGPLKIIVSHKLNLKLIPTKFALFDLQDSIEICNINKPQENWLHFMKAFIKLYFNLQLVLQLMPIFDLILQAFITH